MSKTKQRPPTLSVGIRRILKLADYVEVQHPTKFDFSLVVGFDWKGAKDLSCGTTACALGFATTMPFFRKLGIYLTGNPPYGYVAYSPPAGRDSYGMEAWEKIAKAVFSIPIQAFYALFQPVDEEDDSWDAGVFGDYPKLHEKATPKQWAAHARGICKLLQAEADCAIAA